MPIDPAIFSTNGNGRTAEIIADLQRRISILERNGGGSGGGGGSGTDANAIHRTIVDAAGDLIVGTAPDTVVRFPVGADDEVLTADSGAPEGISWKPGGGGTGGVFPTYLVSNDVATRTLDSASTSLDELADVLITVIRQRTSFPTPSPTYTLSGPSQSPRTLDATSTTVNELAQVLRTFIADLLAGGTLPLWTLSGWLPTRDLDANNFTLNHYAQVLCTYINDVTHNVVVSGGSFFLASGTSLPSSPTDGDLFVFSAATGVSWFLRYRASTAKWDFLGGPPLVAEVGTNDTGLTSATYAAFPTAGPSVTVPLAGTYDVTIEAQAFQNTTSQSFISYDIGGTTASDTDALDLFTPSIRAANSRTKRKAGLTASTTLTMKYKVTGGTMQVQNRRIAILPLFVS